MLSKIKYTAGVAKRLGYVPVKGVFPMPDRYPGRRGDISKFFY
jgi:hypothetical protein